MGIPGESLSGRWGRWTRVSAIGACGVAGQTAGVHEASESAGIPVRSGGRPNNGKPTQTRPLARGNIAGTLGQGVVAGLPSVVHGNHVRMLRIVARQGLGSRRARLVHHRSHATPDLHPIGICSGSVAPLRGTLTRNGLRQNDADRAHLSLVSRGPPPLPRSARSSRAQHTTRVPATERNPGSSSHRDLFR